jgi:hypothetical protein
MSLVSGPGRGGGTAFTNELCVSKHVEYIQSLDTVRNLTSVNLATCPRERVG